MGGLTLYFTIEKQNQLMRLRLEVPKLEKELGALVEENRALSYRIEQFENPLHLMELASQPRFSHLKFPLDEEVMVLEYGDEESQ